MDAEYGYGPYMVLPCFVVVSKVVDLSTIIKSQILIKLFVKLKSRTFEAKDVIKWINGNLRTPNLSSSYY